MARHISIFFATRETLIYAKLSASEKVSGTLFFLQLLLLAAPPLSSLGIFRGDKARELEALSSLSK